MTPELLVLLAASLSALQIVSLVMRREHVDDAPYLGLLIVNLALLVWVNMTHRQESLLAFVGEGMAAMLTLAPRFIERLERAALGRDAFATAARLATLRELITPGRTAARRRRQLLDLALTRSGAGSTVARRLRDELAQVRDPARAAALREELATVLFFDRRFAEGLAEVERHLDREQLAMRPVFAAYLVRAYGEVGRLDEAAEVLGTLEDGVAGRDPSAAGLLLQARLTFLAFAGQPAHVEALLGRAAAAQLPERARDFLRATALDRAGRELSPEARHAVETIFRRASLPEPARRPRRAPVTLALIALNVLVFVAFLARHHDDGGAMVRAGALFRPAVMAGEWWRLFTAMFLHADWLHLGVNMYGLYLLGRFTEEMFGPSRFLAVYLLGGLAGALGSTLVGAGALSVGASGAIMGLLGALIVTLVLRRGAWPEAWRKALLWNLLLLGALQIYIGFQVAMIDNAAHVGGMLGGAAATVLLGPGGLVGHGRRGRVVTVGIAALLSLAVLVAGGFAAATPLSRTLARVATRTVELDGVRLTVPSYWEIDAEHHRLEDPYLDLEVTPQLDGQTVHVLAPKSDDPRYRALFERIEKSARPDIIESP